MKNEKLCKNCKWFRTGFGGAGLCDNLTITPKEYNEVYGWQYKYQLVCAEERRWRLFELRPHCGLTGKYFEAR